MSDTTDTISGAINYHTRRCVRSSTRGPSRSNKYSVWFVHQGSGSCAGRVRLGLGSVVQVRSGRLVAELVVLWVRVRCRRSSPSVYCESEWDDVRWVLVGIVRNFGCVKYCAAEYSTRRGRRSGPFRTVRSGSFRTVRSGSFRTGVAVVTVTVPI